MFNLFSGMNLEKLMVAFLSGMPQAKKEEWMLKMSQAQEQAAQTANDFAHIKETVDILLERQNEMHEELLKLKGVESNAEIIEVAATEAADNTDEILEELKDGD